MHVRGGSRARGRGGCLVLTRRRPPCLFRRSILHRCAAAAVSRLGAGGVNAREPTPRGSWSAVSRRKADCGGGGPATLARRSAAMKHPMKKERGLLTTWGGFGFSVGWGWRAGSVEHVSAYAGQPSASRRFGAGCQQVNVWGIGHRIARKLEIYILCSWSRFTCPRTKDIHI